MPEAREAAETVGFYSQAESPSANPPWLLALSALLGPLGGLLLRFLPLPLEPVAHRLLAIVWAVLVAWVTEVIPLPATALLIAPLLVLVGSFLAAKAMSGERKRACGAPV